MRERASRTAEQVSLAAIFQALDPRFAQLAPAGFVESTERLLLAGGRTKPSRLAAIRRPDRRRFYSFIERKTVPGQWLHLLLRKRFVEEEVDAALAAGAEQLLVVGAGIDTLALRLAPRHPTARMVEIDHPATQAMKAKALTSFASPANLTFLPADLRRVTLPEALATCREWRAAAPTVVVAEGLLMYLDVAAVGRLLDDLRAIAPSGSRLIFSYVRRLANGRFDFGPITPLAVVLHRLGGEPFLWGVQAGELEPFLAAHGFALEGPPERYDLRRRYLEPAGIGSEVLLARLENLAVARLV